VTNEEPQKSIWHTGDRSKMPDQFYNEWLGEPWSDPDSTDNKCEWCYCRKPDVKPSLDPIDLRDDTERILCDRFDSYQYPDISDTGEKK